MLTKYAENRNMIEFVSLEQMVPVNHSACRKSPLWRDAKTGFFYRLEPPAQPGVLKKLYLWEKYLMLQGNSPG